jgi:hypothetical protein
MNPKQERKVPMVMPALETMGTYPRQEKAIRRMSLMTSLGLIEGNILKRLEDGAVVIQDLIHELEWPAHMVLMAAGSLIRRGYVRGIQHEAVLVLEPIADIERRGTA